MINHTVDSCPIRKQPLSADRYIGSFAAGQGFYQIDIPYVNEKLLGNLQNVGIVFVEIGMISKEKSGNSLLSTKPTGLGL